MRPILLLLACLSVLAPCPAYAVPDPGLPAPSREAVWPLVPRPPVVRGFDPPRTAWGAGHRGVDLLGHPGQVVRAALAGRVSFAAGLAGRGVVVVDHGSFRTTYEPVAASVAVGQQVARGEAVGTLRRGASHCPPRACLHWGMRRGAAYLDPLTLVGAGPVRLLPLDAGGPAAAALPLSRLVVGTAPQPAPPLLRGGLRAV